MGFTRALSWEGGDAEAVPIAPSRAAPPPVRPQPPEEAPITPPPVLIGL